MSFSFLEQQLQSDAHEMGDAFGFEQETISTLASMYNVPENFVEQALENNPYTGEDDYDDSMDGDFDSAMTSAGFGTDEDYGYAGDDF